MEFRNSVAVLARGLNPCTPVGLVVGCVDHTLHICQIGAADQGHIAVNFQRSMNGMKEGSSSRFLNRMIPALLTRFGQLPGRFRNQGLLVRKYVLFF